ncbi:Uncharacterised protein [Mycobacteroides abscessus subsp. abscessus]|nr:Uncharacterised protein [Mycobacteroides abscessus subsp. abscessus]
MVEILGQSGDLPWLLSAPGMYACCSHLKGSGKLVIAGGLP